MSTSQTQPISIAIDGNEANVTQRVGSNVYAFELLKHLEQATDTTKNVRFTVCLSTPPVPDMPKETSNWKYAVFGPKRLWTQWAAPLYLHKHKQDFDLWYTPGHYAPQFCPIPYISSVMDLGYFYYPKQFRSIDLFQLSNWTKQSVKNAKKVIAISDSTKEQVTKVYKKPKQQIEVIYPAVNPPKKPNAKKANELLKQIDVTKPFFVYVGTLQPRKNIVRLITAFEQLCASLTTKANKNTPNGDEIQLVLAGKLGWQTDDITASIEQSERKNQIITTGYIDEETKLALLSESAAQLLVGLHEGFGIPALEALHLDTISIVSDTSSLPEVVGKAGILVNPYNSHEIAAAMQSTLTMSAKQRGQQKNAARVQRRKFDWKTSAEKLATILLETAKS